ncbi:mobile mystery protein B [Alkalimarinus alittae]|uniref:Mobile mystery protein B n=1 Tax=Alkalimarinus alittae TaxID=2961619 RepID=A0ABY6N5E6_9ALTE|nr:mobile mystery protein B [Alkalimarinus alittae]UZE97230.1 mobile mystery protein B [Alkalimarinus alittae]
MNEIIGNPDGATPLDPDELEGLIFTHIQTRGQLDQLELINVQTGIKWLKKQKKADPFTEGFVCSLHKRLFGDVWRWAGCFRKTEKNIGCDAIYIGVNLKNLLDDVRYWVEHDIYASKELAARFHHRLVAIHPFPNGNGRFSRIMADSVLTIAMNEEPIDWAGGHNLQSMSDHRKTYIAALRAADQGDYTLLLDFVGA